METCNSPVWLPELTNISMKPKLTSNDNEQSQVTDEDSTRRKALVDSKIHEEESSVALDPSNNLD